MNNIHASDQFLQVIWPDFTAHFRNEVSIASYEVDVAEFMRFCESDFLQLDYGQTHRRQNRKRKPPLYHYSNQINLKVP